MKCTFALLVEDEIHNYVRKKAVEINNNINNGFWGALLPPHISLKQPFKIDSLDKAEKYFDKLSTEIKPLKLKIGPTYLWDQVIALNVEETKELRSYHNKINDELKLLFEDTQAAFDGDNYHFHLTIALWNQSKESYKIAYDKIKDESICFESNISKISMFYYYDDNYSIGSFINYRTKEIK